MCHHHRSPLTHHHSLTHSQTPRQPIIVLHPSLGFGTKYFLPSTHPSFLPSRLIRRPLIRSIVYLPMPNVTYGQKDPSHRTSGADGRCGWRYLPFLFFLSSLAFLVCLVCLVCLVLYMYVWWPEELKNQEWAAGWWWAGVPWLRLLEWLGVLSMMGLRHEFGYAC